MSRQPTKHLLALIEAPDHVCYRYRLEAFARAMTQAGWSLEPLAIARGPWGSLRQLAPVAAADAVILQRRLLPWWRLRLLRKSAKILIYDFDDAVFWRDSNARKSAASTRRSNRFRATVRLADVVTAGSRFLLKQAALWAHPDRVHYFPTCVEPELYPLAEHRRHGVHTRLVWIGSRSTVPALCLAQPGLAAAASRLPGLELRVVCNAFPELAGIRVVQRNWSSESEARELADADIGISWLPEHPWSLGKCGLKVLQYMAAGLPVVANPVGIHGDLVLHGQTGFLAATPGEWAEAVGRLAASPELRAKMGRAARQFVVQNHSVARWSQEFVALLDRLSSPGTFDHPLPGEPRDEGWPSISR